MSGLPPFDHDALANFMRLVPARGRVLSAGRADPRELAHLVAAGYAVDAFTPPAPKSGASPAGVEIPDLTPELAAALPPLGRLWRTDFVLLSLPRETYDGIWSHQVFEPLPPPGWQRTLGIYFSALKPGGILFFSFHPNEAHPEHEVASLVRQSGFQHLGRGEQAAQTGLPRLIAFVARRLDPRA